MPVGLEVITLSVEDAVAAAQGGATALELVQNLPVGGLTPQLDIVKKIRDAVPLHLRVMLRPYTESFEYQPQDEELLLIQAVEIARLGVEGLVFGPLTPQRTVNLEMIQRVKAVAGSLELTMHRAIDECDNPPQELERLQGVAERILTSGWASSVWEGRDTFAAWTQQFPGFRFAAAGGVSAENIAALVALAPNAYEMHVGGAVRREGRVDAEKVRALSDILNNTHTLSPR